MGRIRILDPTASPPDDDRGPGPALDSLAGRTVGIRLDRAWKSWHWVADEWQAVFAAAGARVTRWTAGNRVGAEGERTRSELDEFAASVDVAIVGLGN